jgi:hypothetical protein
MSSRKYIRIDIKQVRCQHVDRMDITQDKDRLQHFVNAVMNLRATQKARYFSTS